jgi:hypothetical protein
MATHNGARRGRKKIDGCVVVLLVGASLFAGLSYLVSEAARWLA